MGDGSEHIAMIDNESEPGSWCDAIYWRQQLDHALWRGPKVGASKEREYIDMSAATSATESSIDNILAERGKRYGDFIDHAAISQHLKQSMACPGWHELSCDQKEALEMIVHKIARILNGDPNYADSWVDIAGYAQLVANRLTRND